MSPIRVKSGKIPVATCAIIFCRSANTVHILRTCTTCVRAWTLYREERSYTPCAHARTGRRSRAGRDSWVSGCPGVFLVDGCGWEWDRWVVEPLDRLVAGRPVSSEAPVDGRRRELGFTWLATTTTPRAARGLVPSSSVSVSTHGAGLLLSQESVDRAHTGSCISCRATKIYPSQLIDHGLDCIGKSWRSFSHLSASHMLVNLFFFRVCSE